MRRLIWLAWSLLIRGLLLIAISLYGQVSQGSQYAPFFRETGGVIRGKLHVNDSLYVGKRSVLKGRVGIDSLYFGGSTHTQSWADSMWIKYGGTWPVQGAWLHFRNDTLILPDSVRFADTAGYALCCIDSADIAAWGFKGNEWTLDSSRARISLIRWNMYNFAIGNGSACLADNGIALGKNALVDNLCTSGIAIGVDATAGGGTTIAIGAGSVASGEHSIAIGGAIAQATSSIAIGAACTTSALTDGNTCKISSEKVKVNRIIDSNVIRGRGVSDPTKTLDTLVIPGFIPDTSLFFIEPNDREGATGYTGDVRIGHLANDTVVVKITVATDKPQFSQLGYFFEAVIRP